MSSDASREKEMPPRARKRAIVSHVAADGRIIEMVYRPAELRTGFVVWDGETWRSESAVTLPRLGRIVPYSPQNNLLRNGVVLLPSEPEEYSSEEALLAEIQAFIHRYVDVSPVFERLASYYVLLTWVYDTFDVLPYLRLRGDPGSGKTRFLLTVGALCCKPMFASGASTVSPLFRILDAFRGTLVIDEADFRLSDERSEIIKILNNGHARGFPVLRSEVTPKGEFNPRAYAVFGPKLIATRRRFEDRALESRCLTEDMGQAPLRPGVPITLAGSHREEALHLRNKLLLFRFRNLRTRQPTEVLAEQGLEPRLNQIFVPLLTLIEDEAARAEIRDLARRYQSDLVAERGMDTEAQLLEVIRDAVASMDGPLSVKEIARWFSDRHGDDYQRPVTAKWIGTVIRTRLGLKSHKRHGVFIISPEELPKLARLYDKYGIDRDPQAAVTDAAGRPGDIGDVGDIAAGS
jgi:hypothetical protein